MDEVHLQQDVLVEAQDAQAHPEQELLPVPAEDVPDPARHVQGEGLGVQGEYPGVGRIRGRIRRKKKNHGFLALLSSSRVGLVCHLSALSNVAL